MPSSIAQLSLAVVVLALNACSSSSDGSPATGGTGAGACHAPALSGTPSFAGTGTASISGTGTLPSGIANGLQLQLLLEQGNASIGVVPDDLFNANDIICGTTFHYSVKAIPAGTYTLTFDVTDPNSSTLTTLFHGAAQSSFTVTGGQMLMHDTTFQLVTN